MSSDKGLNDLMDAIDLLVASKDNIKDFLDSRQLVFYRHSSAPWSGNYKWIKWKILLDESKTKACVRDRQGFKIMDKQPHIQTVTATESVKNMLLSPNEKDRTVAETVLDGLASKKYKAYG